MALELIVTHSGNTNISRINVLYGVLDPLFETRNGYVNCLRLA
jgi:hypothetical protein